MLANQASLKEKHLPQVALTRSNFRSLLPIGQATSVTISSFIACPNNLESVANLSHDAIGSVFFPEFAHVPERG